jgi:hypothetical protein
MSLAECIKTAGAEIDSSDVEVLNNLLAEGISDRDALTALYSKIDKEQADLAGKIKQSGGTINEETTSITGPEGLQVDGRIRGSEGDVDSPVRQDTSQAEQGREADGSLRGLPRNIEGFEPRHSAVVESVATAYMDSAGLGYIPPSMYRPVVISRAKRIAVAYEEMEHNPNDPAVRAAYEALAAETVAQYKVMLDAGVVVEFTDVEKTGDPYAKNPRMVNDDIVDNNHMWVFPTNDGFGTDETFESSGNPLLAESEFTISGRVALVNDLFRAVHDYFGHAKESLGTRAGGEENAWRMHSAMFTPMAQRALTTETRGQNSWVNFGPNAEKNKTARGEDTVFADQKIGLMPEWVSMEGVGDEVSIDGIAMKLEMLNPNFLVGKTIKPTPADLTGGGRAYTGIDSSTVSPIELQGGPIFPLLDSFFDMGIAWAANDKKAMKKLQGTNYVVVSAMSNEAHRSNATVIQSLLSTMDAYVRDGRISAKNIKQLDALIKSTGERNADISGNSFTEFTGFGDAVAYHQWAEGLTFHERMVLAKTLESAAAQKLGAPNFQKIMNSIVDSQYAGHNLHDSQLVIEIDQSPDALVELGTNGTKKHRSYKYGVKGRVIGVLPRPVRRDVLFSSWRQAFDAKSVAGAKTNPDRAFQLSLPTQTVTQDIANDIASKPYTAISSPRQAKLALNFKRDLWKVSGLTLDEGGVSQKDFIAAVAASSSSSTLSEVSPTELRKAVSTGAKKIFQLKDGQIFFALNLGLNYNTVYGLNNAELNDSDVALASVVNNEVSAKGIASPAVMLKAIEEGVTVLDAFAVPSLKYSDGFLPSLYAEFGFEIVERMPFDLTKSTALELADMKNAWRQDGWDESKGLPDLVIMKWRGTDEQRQNARQRWIDGAEGSADSIISPATAKSNREAKKVYGEAVSDANGQAGREGNGSSDTGSLRASERTISGRLRDVLKELDGLTDSERRNLGLDKYNPASDALFQRAQDSSLEPLLQGDEGIIRGYYDPENVLIRLTEASNLSTFLHEFAHFMLDMEQKMGGSRLPAINDWFISIGESVAAEASEYTGFTIDSESVNVYVTDGTTGDGVVDGAILRSTHEHFARGFETYLMEGKSPSSELGTAFAKFAIWLNDVYKREKLNKPNIDGRMRETFSLLLASQEQIENAEARYRYNALFPDSKSANMTDKQWAAYMEKVSGSKAKSVETLRNRLITELTKIADAERNGEKAEQIEIAMESLKEKPIYSTIERLKGELKMDWQSVKDILKTNMPPQLKNMTTRYGDRMLADDAAREAGYGSGSEMLDALMNTKPMAEQAEIIADNVIKERYGDITDNASIMQQVDEAIHNETRGELILLEVRALARGKPDVDKQALKLLAQQAIAKLNYRSIRPEKYHTQEIAAAKKAAVALAAGEPKKALMYKERQAANFFLYKEAVNARDMAEKGAERMKRYSKKTIRKTLGLAGNGYLEQIDGILHRFDFRKSAPVFNVQKWAEERFLEYGDGLVLTDLVLTDADPMSWKDLPTGELEGVLASIANIEHVARYIHKIDVAGESLKYEDAVARALAVGEANNKDKFKPQRSEAEKPLGASDFGAQILAEMTKVGTLTRILDGHADVGIWHQLIMQRITDGGYYKNQLHDMAFKPVIQALKNRSKEDIKRHVAKVFIPELKNTDASGVENDGNMYGSQLISVILNTGNAENLQKMIKGEGWGDDYTANNPIIQAVLAKLTRSDLELIQLIWDQMDMLYEPMAAVHQRTSGVRPPKIAATQLVTEHGTFKGGYFPLAYDYLRSDKAAKFKDAADKRSDQMFENNGGMTSSIKLGATNERQEGFFAPVRFSLDVVAKHFDEVTHFIAFKEPVREVNKLISDPRIKEIIIRKMGRQVYRAIQDWVVDVATDARPLEGANWMERTLSNLSSGLTLGVMGFKASTGIIQVSGLSNSIAHVGAGPMAIALKNIVRSPSAMKEAWQFTLANSKIMSHRMTNLDREMKSALREMSGKSGFMNRIRELSMQHIAYIQTFTVDLPTWHAAYATALEESNGDTVHASQAADWVVENIQGSGATKDMAKLFRRQNAGIKLMTMFMTFFSALFNTMRLSGAGFRSNRYSIFDMASRFFFMIAVPVAFEMIMRDEIDPEEPEEALIAYGKKLTLFPLAAVPLLRDASSAVLSPFGFQLSPLSGSLERGFQGLTGLTNAVASGEDITLSQAANSMALAGIVFRVPATSQIKATTSHMFDDHDLSLHELLFGTKRD